MAGGEVGHAVQREMSSLSPIIAASLSPGPCRWRSQSG